MANAKSQRSLLPSLLEETHETIQIPFGWRRFSVAAENGKPALLFDDSAFDDYVAPVKL